MGAPVVGEDSVRFSVRDGRSRLSRVRLAQQLFRPRLGPDFVQTGRVWTLELPRPEVDRLEYLVELTDRDGEATLVTDPENPLRAPGPFGKKSVVELPGYRPPAWLDEEPPPGDVEESGGALLWRSDDATDASPLLVVHDGPEFAEYAFLLRLLAFAVWEGRLPPLRALLLPPPGDRNQSYSASAAYARRLARLLADMDAPPARLPRVGMGASLGALAAFHAHRRNPDLFGALFLQSGSFFTPRLDRQESGFVRFRRITRFVADVGAGRLSPAPIPVGMTVGAVEENQANNRQLRDVLEAEGYDVTLHVVRDAHNWTAWRDALDPYLLSLLEKVWT